MPRLRMNQTEKALYKNYMFLHAQRDDSNQLVNDKTTSQRVPIRKLIT